MNGWLNPLSDIFWCYTGLGTEPVPTNNVLTYLASSYRPSAVALDIACDQEGRGTFASIERKMGRTDLNETFTRYTYTTPDYVLGTFHVPDLRYWDWQMISSQNRWHGAIFKSHPDARIYFQCTADDGGLELQPALERAEPQRDHRPEARQQRIRIHPPCEICAGNESLGGRSGSHGSGRARRLGLRLLRQRLRRYQGGGWRFHLGG